MLRRVGWWALGGLAVAFFWVLVFYFIGPSRGVYPGQAALLNDLGHSTALWVTLPWGLLLRHVPITWYESLVLNAASYACIGLLVETIRLTVRSSYARLRH
ncbi:MAG: hypothetical protein WAL75_20900 [Terracidiphilus sp.]